jgi:hypothetical protein
MCGGSAPTLDHRRICTQGALRRSTMKRQRSAALGLPKPRLCTTALEWNGTGVAGEMLVILYTQQNTHALRLARLSPPLSKGRGVCGRVRSVCQRSGNCIRAWLDKSSERCADKAHRSSLPPPYSPPRTKVTWLILPVVICLSQRLSHACLSINFIP